MHQFFVGFTAAVPALQAVLKNTGFTFQTFGGIFESICHEKNVVCQYFEKDFKRSIGNTERYEKPPPA